MVRHLQGSSKHLLNILLSCKFLKDSLFSPPSFLHLQQRPQVDSVWLCWFFVTNQTISNLVAHPLTSFRCAASSELQSHLAAAMRVPCNVTLETYACAQVSSSPRQSAAAWNTALAQHHSSIVLQTAAELQRGPAGVPPAVRPAWKQQPLHRAVEDAADEALLRPGSCSGRLGRHGRCSSHAHQLGQSDEEQRENPVVSPAAQRHRGAVGVADPGCDWRDQSVPADRRAAGEQQPPPRLVFPAAALVPALGIGKVPELPGPQEPQLPFLPANVRPRLLHKCVFAVSTEDVQVPVSQIFPQQLFA